MDKNLKQTKAAKEKAEEAALNRILCWVVGGSVLEFLLMLLDRYWVHYGPPTFELRQTLEIVVPIVAFVALAAAAGCLYWWNWARKGGEPLNVPGTLCLFSLGVAGGCFGAWLFGASGLQLMSRAVPVVVVLALIYYLYQKEFFVIATQGALAILGVWICDRGLGGMKTVFCYLYVIAAAALTLAGAVLCRRLQTGKGVLEWKGRKTRLLSKDANYAFLYTGAAVVLAILVCALFSLPAMILYAVSVAWLLVMAVYYTVKMM